MTEYCDCCGAKLVKYWHRLNKGLCGAMIRVYMKNKTGAVKISEILTHNQVCNFQKLKYWCLVEKIGEQEKGGHWRLTYHGERFVKGEIAIPLKVQTFRGKTFDLSGEVVKIGDVVDGYQYKSDYIKEAQ